MATAISAHRSHSEVQNSNCDTRRRLSHHLPPVINELLHSSDVTANLEENVCVGNERRYHQHASWCCWTCSVYSVGEERKRFNLQYALLYVLVVWAARVVHLFVWKRLCSLETCCFWVNTGKQRSDSDSHYCSADTQRSSSIPESRSKQHRLQSELGRRPPAKLSTVDSEWNVHRLAQGFFLFCFILFFRRLSLWAASENAVGFLSVGRPTWS